MTARWWSYDAFEMCADTSEELATLRSQSRLLIAISEHIRARGWDVEEIGVHCGVDEQTADALANSELSELALPTLVEIAIRLAFVLTVDPTIDGKMVGGPIVAPAPYFCEKQAAGA